MRIRVISGIMAEKGTTSSSVDTRRSARYKASGRTGLMISPIGLEVGIQAEMLDLNEHGGLGLFVPVHSSLDPLPLSTFLGGWKVQRLTRKGPVEFTVRVFNSIPQVHSGKPGIRLSALPYRHSPVSGDSKFFISTRRRSKRAWRSGIEVILARRDKKLKGHIENLGDDDGAGVVVEASSLGSVNWGEIFREGWSIGRDRNMISCFVQRLGMQQAKVVVGVTAPGLSRAWGLAPSGDADGDGDEALISLLDSVLKGKKSVKK